MSIDVLMNDLNLEMGNNYETEDIGNAMDVDKIQETLLTQVLLTPRIMESVTNVNVQDCRG
ncbi:hypothetical protein INT47_011302 [Mucor saturninus]|uniref:Uncharacterized protein n=1 Tax=Mucor saturninus TaxID=64648 RepID=A0A8H7RMA7_9FUNG|nr:hypothetical protein INT47_011302 [Mucor saturninus]